MPTVRRLCPICTEVLTLALPIAPILARLELPLHNYTVDGHLFDVTHNLLRQEPNPESNAEWDRIAQLGPMVMSREEVIKMNKDPEKVVKLPEDWGKQESNSRIHWCHG